MFMSLVHRTIHVVLDFSMQLIREGEVEKFQPRRRNLSESCANCLLPPVAPGFPISTWGLRFHYFTPFKSKVSPLENAVLLYYLPISK